MTPYESVYWRGFFCGMWIIPIIFAILHIYGKRLDKKMIYRMMKRDAKEAFELYKPKSPYAYLDNRQPNGAETWVDYIITKKYCVYFYFSPEEVRKAKQDAPHNPSGHYNWDWEHMYRINPFSEDEGEDYIGGYDHYSCPRWDDNY